MAESRKILESSVQVIFINEIFHDTDNIRVIIFFIRHYVVSYAGSLETTL